MPLRPAPDQLGSDLRTGRRRILISRTGCALQLLSGPNSNDADLRRVEIRTSCWRKAVVSRKLLTKNGRTSDDQCLCGFVSYCLIVAPVDGQSRDAADLELTLRAAGRALENFLLAQSRASDLGLLEFLILSRAADEEGVVARDIGRDLGLTTSTTTGVVDRLEQDRLVRRHPHPADRRLLLLKATSKGQVLVKRALGPTLTELSHIAGSIRADERAIVDDFVVQLRELLIRNKEAACPRPSRRSAARASAVR